jgi:hypothetical protein
MKLASFVVLPCVSLLVAGCSGGSVEARSDAGPTDGAVGRDAGSEASLPVDTGPADTIEQGDAPVACNDLTNSAEVVAIEQVAADPPVASGGTIAGGTYTMTAATIYTGTAGPSGPSGTGQTTLRVSGDLIEVVTSGDPPTRTVAFVTSGTSISATDTCPDAESVQGSYTATSSSLVVELPGGTDDGGPRTLVETFTKE